MCLPLFVMIWHVPWRRSDAPDERRVEDEERKKIDSIFEMLDEDKSGFLTRDELQIFAMATCGGLTDKRHGPLETQIENTLDQLDTGANGRLPEAKLHASISQPAPRRTLPVAQRLVLASARTPSVLLENV